MDYLVEQGIWYCVAGTAQRSYLIEQLDRRANQVQLAIYDSPQINSQQLVEIVQLEVMQNPDRGIVGSGTTQAGQTITISALQQTVEFVVNDPAFETALGVCSYFSDLE